MTFTNGPDAGAHPRPEPDPVDLIDIAVQDTDGAAVVTVRGEIDMQTTTALAEALHQAMHRGTDLVVVDLDAVEFLASPGIVTLLEARRAAEQQRCRFRLAGGSRPVYRPIEAAGLVEAFDRYPSVAEAIAG